MGIQIERCGARSGAINSCLYRVRALESNHLTLARIESLSGSEFPDRLAAPLPPPIQLLAQICEHH